MEEPDTGGYSGGTSVGQIDPNSPTYSGSYAYSNGSYGGGGDAYDKTVSCSGQIAATLTWVFPQSGPVLPPPPCAIVTQTCTVSASAPTGSGSTGFPGPGQSLSGGGSLSGILYTGVNNPGASIPVTCTPGASFTPPFGSTGQVSVSYAVTASPITLTLAGTIKDSSGNDNILVGQDCKATLNGIPSALQPYTTYAWKVSGTKFQDWEPTTPAFPNASPPTQANSQASYYDGGSPPATNPTKWYWNDPKNAMETVSCTATVTPPAGQGAAFSVTATAPKPVSVQVPGFTFTATPGYIQINTKAPNQGGALDLYAGGVAGGSAGVSWTATCTTPPLFGKGNVELIQLATPNLSYTEYVGIMKVGPRHDDPQNGQMGLDGQCPYPGSSYTEGDQTPFTSNDSPTAPLSNSIGSIIMTHQFTDYLMYIPPGSSQVVPLATLTWGLNMTGSAIIPSTVNWADYAQQNGSDSAGTVTTTAAKASNAFPNWTLINGPQPISSF